jgi:purine-binding chemotaxis protein CheW
MENAREGSPFSAGADHADGRRASGEALREALRSLGSGGASGSGVGMPLTPEALAELAKRAGLSGSVRTDDLARLLGREPGGVNSPPREVGPQYVIFAVGDVECTLPAEAVQSIERLPDVTPVPNIADWVLGIVQFRGAILSVVDLRRFLGLPPADLNSRNRLIVVADHAMTLALVVDAVLEMRADTAGVRSAAGGTAPEWIAQFAAETVDFGGRRVLLLDVHRLLFADKMRHYQADGV